MDNLMDRWTPPTHLCVSVAVSPHVAALVDDPVDHDAHALLPVHVTSEHLPRLGPDVLLPPDAAHHLLAHQLQQVGRALHLAPGQACGHIIMLSGE